jgi:hypothetical protein
MEATAFFERKVGLTPKDLTALKGKTVNDVLQIKLKELLENKCSEHGFVLPGTVELISRSMGYYEHARFTGDTVYYIKSKGKVLYPGDGIRVSGEVIRKNKLGLYVVHRDALRIQVPRDLHIGNDEFDSVEVGDIVDIEIKKSRFQINDPFILTNGLFIRKNTGETVIPDAPKLNRIIESDLDSEDEEEDEAKETAKVDNATADNEEDELDEDEDEDEEESDEDEDEDEEESDEDA